MNQAIRDDAAIAFSIGFYRALGYGRSIEDAFKFGTNAIQLAIGDGSKNRDAIAEQMRKLVPIGEVSEAISLLISISRTYHHRYGRASIRLQVCQVIIFLRFIFLKSDHSICRLSFPSFSKLSSHLGGLL